MVFIKRITLLTIVLAIVSHAAMGAVDDWREKFDEAIAQLDRLPAHEPSIEPIQGEDMKKVTERFQKVVTFDFGSSTVYPRSLILGKELLHGLQIPIAINPKYLGSATITMNVLDVKHEDKKVSETVDHPSAATVGQAISKLAARVGAVPAASTYALTTSDSIEESFLNLGASASWMGGEVRTRFEQTFKKKKTHFVVRFTQRYFTVSCDPLPKPSDLFDEKADGVEEASRLILRRAAKDNPPLYVSSVTYGREMWLVFSSDESREEVEAALEAGFSSAVSSGKFSVDAKRVEIINNCAKSVFILGGQQENASGIYTDNFASGINEYIRKSSNYSPGSAAPISFQATYLDNRPAVFSVTSKVPLLRQYGTTGLTIKIRTECENLDKQAKVYATVRRGNTILIERDFLCGGEITENTNHPDYKIKFAETVFDFKNLSIEISQEGDRSNNDPHWRMTFAVTADMTDGTKRSCEVFHQNSRLYTQGCDGKISHHRFVGGKQSTGEIPLNLRID